MKLANVALQRMKKDRNSVPVVCQKKPERHSGAFRSLTNPDVDKYIRRPNYCGLPAHFFLGWGVVSLRAQTLLWSVYEKTCATTQKYVKSHVFGFWKKTFKTF